MSIAEDDPCAVWLNDESAQKYEIGKPTLTFTCEWAVYPVGSDSSICYCTDRTRAQMIVNALNAQNKEHER